MEEDAGPVNMNYIVLLLFVLFCFNEEIALFNLKGRYLQLICK